jgi:hypothetical protein
MRLHPHHSHYIEPAFTSSLGAQYKDLEGQKVEIWFYFLLGCRLITINAPIKFRHSPNTVVFPHANEAAGRPLFRYPTMGTVEAMQISHQAHLRAHEPRAICVGVLVIGFRNRYPHPAIFLSAQTLDQNVGTWHLLEVIKRAKWFVSWICNSYRCSSIASVSL